MKYILFSLLILCGCQVNPESEQTVLTEDELDNAKVYRSLEEVNEVDPDSVYILLLHPFESEEITEDILGLENLQWLSLKFGNIKHLSTDDIDRLTSLQRLDLSHNPLQALPENIDKLQYLKLLDISHTEVKTLPQQLTNIDSLRKIFVGRTNIPAEELKTFKRERPNVKIMLEYAVEYDTSMTDKSITELYDRIIDDM